MSVKVQGLEIQCPEFQSANVLVVGDLILDRYWYGSADRVSAEAPIPVVKVEEIEERVGGAGNVALNMASLGCKVTLLAITGQDEAADILKQKLQTAQVNCQLQQVPQLATMTKLRVVSREQQLLRMDFEQNLADENVLEAQEKVFQASLEGVNIIVASGYTKGALTNIKRLIAIANAHNIPVLIDPKGTDFSCYQGATIVKPNLSEFEAVVGECVNETELVAKGKALLNQHSWQALLITRSEQGMTLLMPEQEAIHIPVQGSEVFDVTGAGDTVMATLAGALAAGQGLHLATSLANYAAGIVVAKLGTAVISAHELRRCIHNNSNGVYRQPELKLLVNDSKAHNEKVVMTNGCFDILHAGHIAYLQEAKALGDRLVVAVNSDASVTRLKGVSRPINPLARRMAVLAGLACVDWVVCFEEDTPMNLIKNILPDFLVKGGDWSVEDIVGGDIVVANGGKVMSLSFENGCSTTSIINAIKEKDTV